jgi:phytochrome A
MPISGDGNNVHPGAKVQGYGAVLLISEISETNDGPSSTSAVENGDERRRYSVLAASANAAEVLGVEAEGLIDADIFDAAVSPFEANTRESLREACGASDLGRRTPLVANLRHKRCKAVVVMNRTEEGVVIEVEPVVGDLFTLLQGSLETHTLVQSAVQRLQQLAGSSVSRLCQATADEVQKFLGYERVMVYKFHPDGHGEVVAEVTAASRAPTGSFLGLHFPASDIPPASREILLGVQSRMVANVKQAPVQFVTSPRLPSQSVMLASNELCGVSGSHALNMGVLGALVMPIKLTHNSTDTKSRRSCYSFEEAAAHRRDMTLRCRSGAPPPRSPLWGLLVCHHYSDAYHVDYDHRAATEFMTEVFSLHLSRSLESEDQAARQKLLRVQTTVCNVLKRVSENPDSSQNNNSSLSDSLANALFRDRDAARMLLQLGGYGGGCAMFLGNEWHMAGNCPSTSQLGELLAWLTVEELPTGGRRLGAGGQWGTISLDSEGFPGAKATRHSACGILAISLVESLVNDSEQHGGCVLWTRPEMLQELSWAGNVESEVLRPREGPETEADSSFQAVKKQVELACVPWTGVEVEGTHAVKLLLQDAIKVCEEGRITSRILVAINQERLRNLDELHRVENELQAVIRTANVPIIRLNLALKVAELNPLAVDLFAGRRPSIPMPPRKKGQPTPEPPLGLPFSAYLEYECAHQMEACSLLFPFLLLPIILHIIALLIVNVILYLSPPLIDCPVRPILPDFSLIHSKYSTGLLPMLYACGVGYVQDILLRAVESGTEPEPFHVRLSPRYAEGGHPSAPPSLSPSEDHYWQEELLLFVQMQRDLTTGRVSELVCVCRDITAQAVRP